MGIKTSKIRGYEHWASFLINNDSTSLSESEMREAGEFLRRMRREYGPESQIVDCGASVEFGYPEYGGVAGSVVEYTVAADARQPEGGRL
ncbi:MAG: hypothetical protein CVV52_03690 [Spirochaetae bacterium HGW-Spirochaetae-8]|jgi:hypothetical protein|nr:MAG: hypothetical protein CVV52_03690 [Spirochaetae bacterium HGW-Spirochaetae-8]